jgi:hypothetical protein
MATAWTPALEALSQVLGHPRRKGRPAPARTLAIGMTLPHWHRTWRGNGIDPHTSGTASESSRIVLHLNRPC